MKDHHKKTVAISCTFDKELLARAKVLAMDRGYGFSFSAYVNALLRADLYAKNQSAVTVTG